MTNQNNGGPAFPHDDLAMYNERAGMTLRDYFAAKAMQAQVAARSDWAAGSEDAWHAEVSRLAYATADAMLKAREGGAA